MNGPRRARWWLSEHCHALGWLLFAFLAVALYVWYHHEQRCDYIKHINPQVADAVQLYALRHHVVTGALEIRVGDVPYTFDPNDRGPLGIGALPEARGVLTRATEVVDRYNSALHAYIDGLLDAFYPSPNSLHHMLVPLGALDPKTAVGVDDQADDSKQADDSNGTAPASSAEDWYRLRVSVESYSWVRHQYPNDQALNALIDLVGGATLVRIEPGRKLQVVPAIAGARHDRVAEAAERVRTKRDKLRAPLKCLFEKPASKGCAMPDCTTFSGCSDATSTCAKSENPHATNETLFHRQLRTVVERNIGFFWVSGKYLWYEIMMLAALGVVTRKLVRLATDYAAGDAKRKWQPRESIRTLMHLAVAPVFSLVIIWILTLTHIISVKPLIGDVWSNGTVPIAFLLGLFPSLGYKVLQGLAEGVFGRRLVDEKAPKARPVGIPDAPTPPDGAAASLERLRQRVRNHATAVLRR